jgi:hypothetical protein
MAVQLVQHLVRNVRQEQGSPNAQAVLATLAGGAPGARETEEAKASLERLRMKFARMP